MIQAHTLYCFAIGLPDMEGGGRLKLGPPFPLSVL
jgi:hypothetical protein